MTTCRNGKIARLPRSIREELNQRLANNESSRELLPWLNAHPDVQKILAQYFAGRPILQQNLSEWRRGGYEEWLQHQETRDFTRQLLEKSADLNTDLNAKKIGEAIATATAADFARTSHAKISECTDTDQRLDCLNNLLRQASRLRRNDYHADCQSLRRERWDYKVAAEKKIADKTSSEERSRQMLAWFQLQPDLADQTGKRGGTDHAYDQTAFRLELEHKLPVSFLGRKKTKQHAETTDEFDEIATKDEEARGVTSDNDEIDKILASRIPKQDSPVINPSPAPTPGTETQEPRRDSTPIALSNDCTPEEFVARNHPRSITPIAAQSRPSCNGPIPSPGPEAGADTSISLPFPKTSENPQPTN